MRWPWQRRRREEAPTEKKTYLVPRSTEAVLADPELRAAITELSEHIGWSTHDTARSLELQRCLHVPPDMAVQQTLMMAVVGRQPASRMIDLLERVYQEASTGGLSENGGAITLSDGETIFYERDVQDAPPSDT